MMLTTVPLPPRRSSLSLPERPCASLAALLGGAVHETFQLALPRVVRRSRLYEATAKNLLRVTIELVGGVPAQAPVEDEHEPDAGRLAVRKGAGNVVELGSIAAFGFSPLWVLAAAADVTRGSRVYLDAFVAELVRAGVLPEGSRPGSVDELLGALEGVSGTSARLVDIPPLEVDGAPPVARATSAATRRRCPRPTSWRASSTACGRRPGASGASLLEVSVGIGLAFFNSARHVGRQHLLDPYREDLRPVRDEGFGAYARRVSRPYAEAVARHFDAEPRDAHRARRSSGCVARTRRRARESRDRALRGGVRARSRGTRGGGGAPLRRGARPGPRRPGATAGPARAEVDVPQSRQVRRRSPHARGGGRRVPRSRAPALPRARTAERGRSPRRSGCSGSSSSRTRTSRATSARRPATSRRWTGPR